MRVITVSGIRPDLIRWSATFKKLDKFFQHTLIHTGQHFDFKLHGVFFQDLNIREPDYNFSIGQQSSDHLEQMSHLALSVKENLSVFKKADIVLFLGDSNSVLASALLKKEGVCVGHVEAGMRSGDGRMFEETNRKICDHCSDVLFCYHENYKQNLIRENIDPNKIFVVGNTITEVVKPMVPVEKKKNNCILVDVHRPENFNDERRLLNIIEYAQAFGNHYQLPVKMLNFKRTMQNINAFGIDLHNIIVEDLMSFPDYINTCYHAKLVISDSGTAQEELAYLKTPVLVPRDFTERPESYEHGCSLHLDVNHNPCMINTEVYATALNFFKYDTSWMGDGTTSGKIIEVLQSL